MPQTKIIDNHPHFYNGESWQLALRGQINKRIRNSKEWSPV
jgi:hypothetical protein